jgi:hypothetical protein
MLTVCAFSLLIAGFFHPVTAFTQDLGRHFLLGQLIITTHSVPKTNLFSYTYPDYPFINHHYFSEVLFYLINQASGTKGLLLVMTCVVFLAFSTIFLYSAWKTSIVPVSILSFFYLRVLFERTDIRPEMFGYLLLSIFVVLLYQYREKYSRWILWLVPLELLWVQLHISFVIGLVVIGLFFIDSLLLHRKKIINPHTFQLGIVLLSSTLLTLINPNGLAGALYPFHIFQNYGYTIEENQTIFFLESLFFKPTIPYFKLCVLFLFISLMCVAKKTKPIDWLLAITFTYLAGSAVRNFPLFVFATLIPASFAFNHIWEWIHAQMQHTKIQPYLSVLPFLLSIFFLWQIPKTAAMRGFGLGVTSGAEKAADFYLDTHLNGPVFNNFDIGSYLEYRIFPTQKVFIDGRPEAYPVSFFKQVYIPLQQDPQVFMSTEKQYKFNTIFFAHTDQTPWAATFLQTIFQNKSWIPVYLDHDVIILVKDTLENKMTITKYGMTAETLTAKNIQQYSTRELFQLANFYQQIHNTNQMMTVLNEVLRQDPNNCQVLSVLLSSQSQSTENPAFQVYADRYNRFCR